ncbi:hypothetical protein BV898_02488 [Hypsibius exemplaris]|uniref:Fibronectin type-III domain-containing protein n=1 Tax=Hypsibius exemplaris TaxID=2072580 RepID=A0A1W0X8A5_HYPEX|nr:hypothetical protein BV898_02488 [Hypsibius exemplaris]
MPNGNWPIRQRPNYSMRYPILMLYLAGTVWGTSPVQEIFRLQANNPLFDLGGHSTVPVNAHSSVKSLSHIGGDSIVFTSTPLTVHVVLPPPRNLTLLTSGIDPDGKAYVQISWLPPTTNVVSSATDISPTSVDRYRITWHTQVNPKEEFRKTVDGESTSYTIEHLQPNSLFVVELQAFRWVGEKKLRSMKVSLVVRTIIRKATYAISQDNMDKDRHLDGTFLLADHNITVNAVFFQNGLLKANLSWSHIPTKLIGEKSRYPDSYVVRWYPKVCLGAERKEGSPERLLVKPLLTTTNTNNVLVYDLNFNCRYAVAIYQRTNEEGVERLLTERLCGVKHFVTPLCDDVVVLGSALPHCPKLHPRLPGSPQNVSCLFLVQVNEISATCSWEPPPNPEQPIIGYRTMYARKLQEPNGLYGYHPFPVLNRNSFIMKVLEDDEMSFSIANLEQETEYIIHIQAISSTGFGPWTRLEFVTPRLMNSVALSQTRNHSKQELLSSANSLFGNRFSSCHLMFPSVFALIRLL